MGGPWNTSKGSRQVNLNETLADAEGQKGTVWTLEDSEDLNANLVRFPSGEGVGEYVNEEVDVLMVGIGGLGTITVAGREQRLSEGGMVFVPKGVRRSVKSESNRFAYLSIHRSRGPLRLDPGRETGGTA